MQQQKLFFSFMTWWSFVFNIFLAPAVLTLLSDAAADDEAENVALLFVVSQAIRFAAWALFASTTAVVSWVADIDAADVDAEHVALMDKLDIETFTSELS